MDVYPVTVTLPVMSGWMVQWYEYVPAVVNTCENEAPVDRRTLPNEPLSAVTVCWMAGCRFVHVTRVPTRTVMLDGVKAKFAMPTA
jgi:hypothetical protein